MGVSSATIRNELVVLEENGYLTHPHTSAGRIPTEKGYRYFVESLMDEFEIPKVEQRMISHQFHQVTLDVDQWMRLSAAVLAHASHSAALVTAPQSTRCRFKHVQLVSINDQVALLVLVLQEGTIKQQMLSLAEPVVQEELTRTSNRLNDHFAGLNVEQIHSTNLTFTDFENSVVLVVTDLMRQIDTRSSHEVYRDGIMDILRQPEFSAIDRMQALLEMLEQRTTLETMLSELAPERGVQVVIGGESRVRCDERLQHGALALRFARRSERHRRRAWARADALSAHDWRSAVRLQPVGRFDGADVRQIDHSLIRIKAYGVG